jgi:ethanolamine transporter EutH
MDIVHAVSLDFRHGTHLSFIRSINAGARMTFPVIRVGKLDGSRDAGPPIVLEH